MGPWLIRGCRDFLAVRTPWATPDDEPGIPGIERALDPVRDGQQQDDADEDLETALECVGEFAPVDPVAMASQAATPRSNQRATATANLGSSTTQWGRRAPYAPAGGFRVRRIRRVPPR